MSKKVFSLKNYLEPIDFEYSEPEEENELLLLAKNINASRSYPLTKEELIAYISTEEFLSSIHYDFEKGLIKKEEGKIMLPQPLDNIYIKDIIENIPPEKKQEEIEFEKRRRYQAYKMLDYTLSNFTYFDFFSADAFQIAKNSKYISQLYGKEKVGLETLFVPFFDTQFEVGKLLQSFGFDDIFLKNLSLQLKNATPKGLPGKTALPTRMDRLVSFLKKVQEKAETLLETYLPWEQNNLVFNQHIRYSYQVHQIFEKSAENALNRFKTPVITPEILFITLMEEKDLFVGKLIKKNIPDETTWYLLRYKLLKRLYVQESNVRSQVTKNQYFFAYLLKIELSEANFEKLIEKKLLAKAVSLFRNLLIQDLLKADLFESFELETQASLRMMPRRNYST
jgi:hypothetical protein